MTLRGVEMRNRVESAWLGLLLGTGVIVARMGSDGSANAATAAPTKKAAPAPVRDLNGVWAAPVADARLNPTAPLTPYGKAQFATHKNDTAYSVAASNDPLKTCDPQGFPRNVLNEIRGIEFEQVPNKMLELLQYQRTWREIWTDGRRLPTNVGEPRADPIQGGTASRLASGMEITPSSWTPSEPMTRPGSIASVILAARI